MDIMLLPPSGGPAHIDIIDFMKGLFSLQIDNVKRIVL